MFPLSDSFKTGHFPVVNIAIITVVVFVFVQQLLAPNQELFISKYALIPSLVSLGDFTTLYPFVTAMFLHGGFIHIISNMWFLWVFGDNVEAHIGFIFYPLLYFASGIVGNVIQYFFMPNSTIPMLGASGAVAGVLGAYYVLFPHSKIKTLVFIFFFITVMEIPAAIMLGYWFLLQLVSGATSLPFSGSGGIAFWAHVGGFVTGVIFAKILKREGQVDYE